MQPYNQLETKGLQKPRKEMPDLDARSARSLIENWHFLTKELTVLDKQSTLQMHIYTRFQFANNLYDDGIFTNKQDKRGTIHHQRELQSFH